MAGFWGEVHTSPEIVLHLSWEFSHLPWKVMHLSPWESFNDMSKWKFDGCLGSTIRKKVFFVKLKQW
jgi:hypothetical protein